MTDKELKYTQLLKEAAALLDGENDLIANMANLAALIHETMGFWWTGFYIIRKGSDGKEQLVLGPFQGPIACTRIAFGRGVCGTSWQPPRDYSSTRCGEVPGTHSLQQRVPQRDSCTRIQSR